MPDVLVVSPDFPPAVGGIQTVSHRLVSAFERYSPRVVTLPGADSAAFDARLPFAVNRALAARGPHKTRIVALNGAAFVDAVRRPPAVILSMHIVTGPGALAAGRALARPAVVYAHAQELVTRPVLARHVLRSARAVLAVSRYTRALAERAGCPSERIRIVPPGIDGVGTEPPVRNGVEPAVIVVGRLYERYKGHDVLLRAIALVRQRVPDARLDVVGDGPLRSELESQARALGVADATTFHGRVSDSERDALMRRASVFAMPSRTDDRGAGEGFGVVYLEAAAQGLPVIAGRVAGAADAVVDGETGFLVDPENPAAVADAITSLLLDRAAATRMGTAGWQRAGTYSWPRAAARVEAILDEVTAA
jgi:phosphatidylinositol alpha-1,6-mannosyltransferase